MLQLPDIASLVHQKLFAQTFQQLKQNLPLFLHGANAHNA